MFRKTSILLACTVLTMAAAKPPSASKTSAAKATAAKPAAATPAKPAVSPIANFDARNPQSVMAVLNAGGGKASLLQKDTDAVLLTFTSVAANFTVLFANCDAQGRACNAVAFDYADDKPGPTFAQVNAFNQTSAMCRSYEDRSGKAHIVYSTLLFADDPYDHFRTQMLAWTGCIGEFRNFLKDPNGYLASAP